MDVIKLAASKSGPTRLCLLPRDATSYPRRAVCGGEIFKANMSPNTGRFRITARGGMEKSFDGKLWESGDAYAWCLAHARAGTGSEQHDAVPSFTAVNGPVSLNTANVAHIETLEAHPLWGRF
jgi:hypothetical protein